MQLKEYFDLNKKMWNDRVSVHLDSELYAMEKFKAGQNSLNEIELELLKDVTGLKILHLQCHFGQDSLSLARLGAKVTGVDFSEEAIQTARALNDELGLNATFICSDVLELDQLPEAAYDIIFTSYGTITWLPELSKWGANIHKYLKPGGKFILAEFHPAIWMYDDKFTYLQYGYFNCGPIIEENEGSYADKDAPIKHTSVGWNHALDEVLSALLPTGLRLSSFKEYDYSPYNIFHSNTKTDKGFQIKGLEGKLPLVYSLMMEKNL
jgi:SAM-dependent methyltransferase